MKAKTFVGMGAAMFLASAVLAEDMGTGSTPAAPMEQASPAPAAGNASVTKLTLGTGVDRATREVQGEAKEFSDGVGHVYCLTTVKAEEDVALHHVWSADGKEISDVTLNVKTSPAWRTWSYQTMWPGAWKVEVKDESGNVLSSAEFTVTKGDNMAPTEPAAPSQSPQ